MSSLKIAILLLKTKSIPSDSYEEYFSSPGSLFTPVFVPVLEHKPNVSNLEHVKKLLHEGELKRRYGGMIFTSQRAVEGFAQIVQELERERSLAEDEKKSILVGNDQSELGSSMKCLIVCCVIIPSQFQISHHVPNVLFELSRLCLFLYPRLVPISNSADLSFSSPAQSQLLPSIPPTTSTPIFPLYTVGPATSRTLRTLLSTSPTILSPLHPEILGSDTGNGEALAKYILEHYKTVIVPSSQSTTSRESEPPSNNADADDFDNKSHPCLPPLLFLVGEQRRDIIPKTLESPSLSPNQRIQVEELVVYGTRVMESFPTDLDKALRTSQDHASIETGIENTRSPDPSQSSIVVITVFSPTGCRELLQRLGLLDQNGRARPSAPSPPEPEPSSLSRPQPVPKSIQACSDETGPECLTEKDTRAKKKYIITTIGPTTYNYLQTTFGYQADICAETPSPDGVGKAVETFLRSEGLI